MQRQDHVNSVGATNFVRSLAFARRWPKRDSYHTCAAGRYTSGHTLAGWLADWAMMLMRWYLCAWALQAQRVLDFAQRFRASRFLPFSLILVTKSCCTLYLRPSVRDPLCFSRVVVSVFCFFFHLAVLLQDATRDRSLLSELWCPLRLLLLLLL